MRLNLHGDSAYAPTALTRATTKPNRLGRWLLYCSLAVLGCVALGTNQAHAQKTISSASTSRKSREEAIKSIPFDELNEQTKRRLWNVVSKPSLYRRMPAELIDCDPDMYLFLVRYPEVIVNIWDLMDITTVKLTRTGKYTFDADDGAGTTAKVNLVYGTNDVHIIYAEGMYDGSLLRNPVRGECVLVLRSAYHSQQNGRSAVSNVLDCFIRIDHGALDLVTKTLSPLVGKTADYNFRESIRFVARVSREAEKDGPRMEQMSGRLNNIAPGVRDGFARASRLVYERGMLNRAYANEERTTAKQVIPASDGAPRKLKSHSGDSAPQAVPKPTLPRGETIHQATPPRRAGPSLRR